MPLLSEHFKDNEKLKLTLVSDADHITKESPPGEYVRLIQETLMKLANNPSLIADDEIRKQSYGDTTALAVLKYKQGKNPPITTYQNTPDDIVVKRQSRRWTRT